MNKAVQATSLHMTLTNEAPHHSLCPEGDDPWCSYNRALASNAQEPFTRAVAEAVSRFNQGMSKTSKAVAEQLDYSTGSCLTRRSSGVTRVSGTRGEASRRRNRLRKADKAHTESEKAKKMANRHKPDMSQDYCPPRTRENLLTAEKL
ncbi:hypothetical protein HPB47_019801 [Ixodes persulcatus]|uniref:Uncharacterized protein n=1 Tax=Ixodes persulcatus TaxID=34615 RepID=A0AC60QKQ5_IXOPE|nr:hypothetical protein HPB47_019801 [Ixodes persulcatus]